MQGRRAGLSAIVAAACLLAPAGAGAVPTVVQPDIPLPAGTDVGSNNEITQGPDGNTMAKKEGNRPKITLACTNCKRRNYNTVKNRVNDRDRIELKKYCRWCRSHTLHRETR